MQGALTGFAIIAVVILAGYIVGRTGIAGKDARYALNRTAFYIASPALLFTVLARTDIHQLFGPVLVTGITSFFSVAITFFLISRLAFKRSAAHSLLTSTATGYSNINNIGLSVATYVIGDDRAVAPLFLWQLVVVAPILLTVLDFMRAGRLNLKLIALTPFRNPIVLGALLGTVVSVTGAQLPDVVMKPLEILGGAAIPMMLMAFGISLHNTKPLARGTRVEVGVATGLKLVIMPLVAFATARVLNLDPHMTFACTVLAALPTAQNVFNYAAQFDVAVTTVRDIILVTTLASLPVVLVIAALLHP